MASWKESFFKEIGEIAAKNKITEDGAFISWYVSATEELKIQQIPGLAVERNNDPGFDVVYVDDKAKTVKVIRSDYAGKNGDSHYESEELTNLGGVYDYLVGKKEHADVKDSVHKHLKEKLDPAKQLIADKNYSVRVQYVTNRKNPNGGSDSTGPVEVRSMKELERIYEEWRHGHVPDMGDIPFDYEDILEASVSEKEGAPKSYIIHVNTNEIRGVYSKWKEKLFSRNVRIFYGDTKKANKEMQRTLSGEPEKFWYFNNGVTILSEKVSVKSKDKRIVLTNPQVINGCQTISTIGETDKKDGKAYILAKVIEIADDSDNQEFIDGIIQANNRQTPVDERILKSNHPLQVALQRKLEEDPWNYFLERKEGQYKKEKEGSSLLNGLTCLKNIDLVKAAVAVKRAPHTANESEDELFSTHFSTVFVEDKPTVDYLLPFLLWNNIVKIGRKHRDGKRRQFNKLASYHVLKMAYDTCTDLRDNTKKRRICEFLQESDGVEKGTIEKLYDIAYGLYGKSEYSEQNAGQRDFFKHKDTYVKLDNATGSGLRKELEKMFRGS